jgi:hypothetical protein
MRRSRRPSPTVPRDSNGETCEGVKERQIRVSVDFLEIIRKDRTFMDKVPSTTLA